MQAIFPDLITLRSRSITMHRAVQRWHSPRSSKVKPRLQSWSVVFAHRVLPNHIQEDSHALMDPASSLIRKVDPPASRELAEFFRHIRKPVAGANSFEIYIQKAFSFSWYCSVGHVFLWRSLGRRAGLLEVKGSGFTDPSEALQLRRRMKMHITWVERSVNLVARRCRRPSSWLMRCARMRHGTAFAQRPRRLQQAMQMYCRNFQSQAPRHQSLGRRVSIVTEPNPDILAANRKAISTRPGIPRWTTFVPMTKNRRWTDRQPPMLTQLLHLSTGTVRSRVPLP